MSKVKVTKVGVITEYKNLGVCKKNPRGYAVVRVITEYKNLDAWKKNPRGYAVAVCPPDEIAHIEVDDSWKNVQVVEVNVRNTKRLLDKFREEFDVDPNGFRPRLFVITRKVFDDPINVQFVRRAMVIIERF